MCGRKTTTKCMQMSLPKEQSKMDNPEKLAIQGTQDEENKTNTQHKMCWTPLYRNKYK